MDKISVIMSVYQETEELIFQSIDSILTQTYDQLEVIVIIDNPANFKAIKLIKQLQQKDNRIKIYINDNNIGLPRSLNRAISHASGKYIARMDADDISLPTRLEKELYMLKNEKLDLVASGIVRVDMDGKVIKSDKYFFSSNKVNKLLKYTDVLPHPTWLVRKELYDALGGYRDFCFCEDYDFLLRAKKRNARMGMAPFLLLKYRSNANGLSQSNSLKQTLSTFFLSKNYDVIENITQNDLEEYQKKHMTKRNITNYRKGTEELLRIAQADKFKIGDVLRIFKSILLCKFLFLNYRQLFIKKIYSFKCDGFIQE